MVLTPANCSGDKHHHEIFLLNSKRKISMVLIIGVPVGLDPGDDLLNHRQLIRGANTQSRGSPWRTETPG